MHAKCTWLSTEQVLDPIPDVVEYIALNLHMELEQSSWAVAGGDQEYVHVGARNWREIPCMHALRGFRAAARAHVHHLSRAERACELWPFSITRPMAHTQGPSTTYPATCCVPRFLFLALFLAVKLEKNKWSQIEKVVKMKTSGPTRRTYA
jgi:hypothetical protein